MTTCRCTHGYIQHWYHSDTKANDGKCLALGCACGAFEKEEK